MFISCCFNGIGDGDGGIISNEIFVLDEQPEKLVTVSSVFSCRVSLSLSLIDGENLICSDSSNIVVEFERLNDNAGDDDEYIVVGLVVGE